MERIRPFLDGGTRLDQLVADLPPQAAQHVRTLVELLVREGFVRDAEGDLPHGLSPEVRARHCALIDFIALRADSPEHRFERYRNCAPVVVGSGSMGSALVLALLSSGVAHVRFRVVEAKRGGSRTDLPRLEECVELIRGDGRSFRYEAISGELSELPDDAGAALLVTDEFDAELTMRVHTLALRSGLVYGHAVADGRHAHIRTLSPNGDAQSLGGIGKEVGQGTDARTAEPADRYLGGPVAALAANQLCLQLLRKVAQLEEGGAEEPGTALLDLATGRFLPTQPAQPAQPTRTAQTT
ncbi:hypothetical protein [Streptacidiphilus sp. P02-A3a]|uniref:hypothetical protein n=1 Tax=Streptacidiphilus sp. P02-A3a TaxID=2704468 RepID=UPI001CDD506F|nr:hypothetical protein [Streptacidiphilus sp. P02-A3a]